MSDPRVSPVYVGSEIYRNSSYGPKHPLAIPRVSTCTDLCRALGWLPDARFVEAPIATDAELARFHDPAYVAALRRAEATQSASPEDRARFRIGVEGNPIYREMFRRPAISAGGVILAARLTRDGGVVHCPGGGTHHGRRDRAAGFCFINDPVLGLYAWLDAGLDNIVYLDIDAHHGDGVQDAFHDDPRVFTISVHEDGRWPFTGAAEDRAGGAARNFPVPPGCNDSELDWLMRHAILPLVRTRRPQAIMLQCGADALEEDPLAKLSLSNNAHWAVARAMRGLAPRLVVLGGGGYNPWTVGRCWAGIWATLNGFSVPDPLPPAAEAVLRGLRFDRAAGRNPPAHWSTTLRDPPREGPVRAPVKRLAELALTETLPA
ncbi:MAG TPA: acetoin utilization protein AcuC [Acetobacteraceae bacterium]|nr:acetoin utilization protein AcuC [Acetobacteraceae bacterium]